MLSLMLSMVVVVEDAVVVGRNGDKPHFTILLWIVASVQRLSLYRFVFLFLASPQQDDLRLSGLPSGQGAGGGARTLARRVPADLRADSLAPCDTAQSILGEA
ncbi:hypothetical protein PoB_003037500 [Plakobranchus ocellatus]|uniref:Secreted protein n=1 Tax=Plakobranchus ocellatus TaxID=259542 RepID=A0AAV4AAP5_9GAST|nr:hypothetical protein PoB_003037500 [Plakobranchus ocellatus]